MTHAPAATVILLRDGPEACEVLLMQRGSHLAFHGGAWVFPGGRVDPSEQGPDELEGARRAAKRETLEEAGLELSEASLVPFSHWTTPDGLPRRFATWFFVTQVHPSLPVRVDNQEIHAYRWLTPQQALAEHAARALELPPPTYVTLTVLATTAASRPGTLLTAAELMRSVQVEIPTRFVPRPKSHAAGIVSLYQGDAAYDEGDLERPGPRHRLCMFRTGWSYQRLL
jgi:8-oxo-dGTP pyrophosphatase MutT (NUDIX family)